MRQMREEAARRAREMQARAHIPQQQAHTGPHRQPVEQEPGPEPPEPQEPAVPQPEPPSGAQTPAAAGSMLETLFQDKERTIILALLILLSNDGDHHELMFALMFLLM